MKKLMATILAVFTVTACLASCSGGDNGDKTTETKDDVTTEATVTTEEISEGKKYALNPILTRSYRKNDTEVQFRFDAKVKAATDLTKCVYISETEGGEPIAFAKEVIKYSEGDYSEKWTAVFENAVPETFYLSIKIDGGNDPEIKAALVTEDGKGVYADKTLADGTRYTSAKNGDTRIIDYKWNELSINPDDDQVTYYLPDEISGDMMIAHADNISWLVTVRSGPGGYVEATFTGTVVEIYNIVENDSVSNDLRVSIDGVEIETLDGRVPFDKTYEGLGDGEHTIRLTAGENTTSTGQDGANKYMFYISGIKFATE